jgi:hypothetical protein
LEFLFVLSTLQVLEPFAVWMARFKPVFLFQVLELKVFSTFQVLESFIPTSTQVLELVVFSILQVLEPFAIWMARFQPVFLFQVLEIKIVFSTMKVLKLGSV